MLISRVNNIKENYKNVFKACLIKFDIMNNEILKCSYKFHKLRLKHKQCHCRVKLYFTAVSFDFHYLCTSKSYLIKSGQEKGTELLFFTFLKSH